EARLSLLLKHHNIVRAFQMGVAEPPGRGLHYLVMEYLEGETLEELIQRRAPLPPPEAVRLVYQALLGLQHMHGQGLVHRDLKPANMMLLPLGSPQANGLPRYLLKILDIGLGRPLLDEAMSDSRMEDAQLTTEGVLLGTPDYMAPEQAKDARLADIR